MKYRPIARLLLFSFTLAILEPSSLLGQVPLRSTNTSTAHSYFAIMGQVARPGVFELGSPNLTLVQLVQKAGGLTRQASESIRIVRDGRAGIRTFYSETNSLTLLPNDLVVVDSRSVSSQSNRIIENPFAKRTQTAKSLAGQTGLQIALINLIDRPVVLKLRNQQADLQSVVAMLQQQPAILSTIQVLQVVPRRGSRTQSTKASTLKPSSVLVFDRTGIEFDRLPDFPEPIREVNKDDSATNNPAKIVTGNSSQPTVPKSLPSLGIQPQTQHVVAPPVSTSQQAKQAVPTIAEPRSSVPLGLTSPLLEKSQSETSQQETPTAASETIEEQIEIPLMTPNPREANAKEEVVAKSPDNSSVFWVVCVAGFLGVGGAVWILWSLASQQIKASAPSANKPPVEPKMNRLQVLIDKSCPLVLEEVKFPNSFEYYGRPRKHQMNRVDQQHELQGPHFDVVTPEESQEDQPAAIPKQIQKPSKSLRVDSSHAATTIGSAKTASKPTRRHSKTEAQKLATQETGVLGRVLANFQQEGKQP